MQQLPQGIKSGMLEGPLQNKDSKHKKMIKTVFKTRGEM